MFTRLYRLTTRASFNNATSKQKSALLIKPGRSCKKLTSMEEGLLRVSRVRGGRVYNCEFESAKPSRSYRVPQMVNRSVVNS